MISPVNTGNQDYQNFIYDSQAIYLLTPSYSAFSKYYIITPADQYLVAIQAYLISNYGTYLKGGQLQVGLRLYNDDGSLDYQLITSTIYGTFTAILTYYPNKPILLKSLSVINFFIMDVDYSNCRQKNIINQNCQICSPGFRNFQGRCKPYNPNCVYFTDECRSCQGSKRLVNGQCQ